MTKWGACKFCGRELVSDEQAAAHERCQANVMQDVLRALPKFVHRAPAVVRTPQDLHLAILDEIENLLACAPGETFVQLRDLVSKFYNTAKRLGTTVPTSLYLMSEAGQVFYYKSKQPKGTYITLPRLVAEIRSRCEYDFQFADRIQDAIRAQMAARKAEAQGSTQFSALDMTPEDRALMARLKHATAQGEPTI